MLAGRVAGLARRGCDGIVIVMCAADATVARSAARMIVGRNMFSCSENEIVLKVELGSCTMYEVEARHNT